MGCDIHTALQRKTKTGEWETILINVLDNRDYNMFGFLSNVRCFMSESWTGVCTEGFPDDFIVDDKGRHEGHYMGEHSFGHVNLKDLVEAELPYDKPTLTDKIQLDKTPSGFEVTFIQEEELDDMSSIRELQAGIGMLFGYSGSYTCPTTGKVEEYGAQIYRLVVGYDS